MSKRMSRENQKLIYWFIDCYAYHLKGVDINWQTSKQKPAISDYFLYNLRLEAKKNNVKAYLILNFRDLSETYAIDIHNFDEFYKMTNKKSISIDEARQLGKQLSQQRKRTRYRYEISDLFN